MSSTKRVTSSTDATDLSTCDFFYLWLRCASLLPIGWSKGSYSPLAYNLRRRHVHNSSCISLKSLIPEPRTATNLLSTSSTPLPTVSTCSLLHPFSGLDGCWSGFASSPHLPPRRFSFQSFPPVALLLSFNPFGTCSAVESPPLPTLAAAIPPQLRRSSPRKNVALATTFGAYHFDVLLPIGWSISSVLGRKDTVKLYTTEPYGLPYGFDTVLQRTGIFEGEQRHHEALVEDVRSMDVFGEGEGMIDMIILGTCVFDLPHWSQDLLREWDERPDDEKFTVVCVVHESDDERALQDLDLWARRGALRYLVLSQHVATDLRKQLNRLADSNASEHHLSMVDYVPIDIYVPILPVPDAVRPPSSHALSRAVIQGLFERSRRDFDGVFFDLIFSLSEDPSAWGYEYPEKAQRVNLDRDTPPFELHLVGGNGNLDIPEELQHVVHLHRHLDYWTYYELMQSMDVVLPAFATEAEYYDTKASSTVVKALQCNVPILGTSRLARTYTHFSDPSILIGRPHALREVQALRCLRTGVPPAPPVSSDIGHDSRVRVLWETEVLKLLTSGWRRENDAFTQVKGQVWQANAQVAERLLWEA
ncbi:hypothetical protein CALVIDRAFT_484889 [Calocera viscosa TUFC12733]|uniref:Uncharacterized protein n=1 Tax=Calocera viscosa (strain TUFC12733) TaxID=1330018 RepID=A0A167JWY8_CALVF|nr:hypothetical protein CALVIDRAFT_484889 [Calocera viscosa TUFC12733]